MVHAITDKLKENQQLGFLLPLPLIPQMTTLTPERDGYTAEASSTQQRFELRWRALAEVPCSLTMGRMEHKMIGMDQLRGRRVQAIARSRVKDAMCRE